MYAGFMNRNKFFLSSLHLNNMNFEDEIIQIKFNDKTIGRFLSIQNSYMVSDLSDCIRSTDSKLLFYPKK